MTHSLRSRCQRLGIIAVGVLLLCFATPLIVRAKDAWTKVRSQNFQLVGNASDKEIRQVANRLEQFRMVFALLFPSLKLNSPAPTTVIVFNSEQSYEPFKINPNVSGYFQAGEDVNYITLTSGKSSAGQPYRTIFHEYVHLLVENTVGATVPLWFNEGLAEYYSTFDLKDDNRKVVLGKAIKNHVLYLREQKLLPLRELFAVDYKSPYYNERDKVNIFYAQSWLLMHYLLQGNNQRRRPQLERFLDSLRSGAALEDAFQQAFQTSFDAFESDFKSYLQNAKYVSTAFTFEKKVAFNSEMNSTPISKAEAQTYLADLLLHIKLWDAAEARLKESLNLNPDSSMTLTSIGILRLRQGRFAEAQQYLKKAVAEDPQNYAAHYYYAFALSREGMDEHQYVATYSAKLAETMRTELRKAIALKPDFIETYALLGFINLVRNEELDDTIALLRRAQASAPINQRLLFMLAKLYARKKEFAASRQLLEPIARHSSDPQMRERAQSVLEDLARVEEQIAPNATASEAAVISEEESTPAPRDSSAELNAALEKPRDGESRVQGILADIECDIEGITFRVRVGQRLLAFYTDSFRRVSFKTFTRDIRGEVTCGPRKPEDSVVVYYTVARNSHKSDGQPTSIQFVPREFQLLQ